jgi:Na+-driven multidrug efflux pump
MTAHQALMAIESLGFIAASAFGVASATLVAQKLGAKEPEQAAHSGHISAFIGAASLTVVGLFFFVAAESLVGLFSDDPDVIVMGTICLMVAAIAQPLMAITDVYAGALRGAGDTRTPMLAAIVGPFLIRLTTCWYFAFEMDLGLLGIWIGSTADWAVRSIWLYSAFVRGRWKTIEL